MRRFLRFDHLGNPLGEVSQNDLVSLVRREQINGEHSLEITTLQVLGKNERILYQDGRGVWREYVIAGVDEDHASGNRVLGTYYAVWSVMPDLMGMPVSVMPGVQNPVAASVALQSLLSGQTRWTVGTVTQATSGGASMYDMDAWKACGVLVEVWGGELSTTIEVGTQTGVTARRVDLHDHLGTSTATRRFDFGRDLKSVKRRFADSPLYCRISPRGAGEETEAGGYGRKIRITEVNDGKDYLEYAPMVNVAKLPDGNGYIYPTAIIENSDCKTPAELLAWAQGQLEAACTPKVTYDVDVIQAAAEGVDATGVSLGDNVQIVDRYFNSEDLRLTGRVVEMTVDELGEQEITVKIGNIDESLSDMFGKLTSQLSTVSNVVWNMNGGTMSTSGYLSNLLARLNAEINATGGYTYITEGQGLRTYDTEVSDPLVGAEASAVVELKGGTMRIANSRTSGGDWEWKTVFTSGRIASELLQIASITSTYSVKMDGGGIEFYYGGDYIGQARSYYGGSSVKGVEISSGDSPSASDANKTRLRIDKRNGLDFSVPSNWLHDGVTLANSLLIGNNACQINNHYNYNDVKRSSYLQLNSTARLARSINDNLYSRYGVDINDDGINIGVVNSSDGMINAKTIVSTIQPTANYQSKNGNNGINRTITIGSYRYTFENGLLVGYS